MYMYINTCILDQSIIQNPSGWCHNEMAIMYEV